MTLHIIAVIELSDTGQEFFSVLDTITSCWGKMCIHLLAGSGSWRLLALARQNQWEKK